MYPSARTLACTRINLECEFDTDSVRTINLPQQCHWLPLRAVSVLPGPFATPSQTAGTMQTAPLRRKFLDSVGLNPVRGCQEANSSVKRRRRKRRANNIFAVAIPTSMTNAQCTVPMLNVNDFSAERTVAAVCAHTTTGCLDRWQCAALLNAALVLRCRDCPVLLGFERL